MRERPILFSAPMVRATLTGGKTQTRRIVKLEGRTIDSRSDGTRYVARVTRPPRESSFAVPCPYGAPGDRLWVRETHAQFSVGEGLDRPVPQCVAYRATCDDDRFNYVNGRGEVMRLRVTKWTPAIYMPRWASRITLEVTGARVERLHEITEEDARAEGVWYPNGAGHCWPDGTARRAFTALWREINGPESWDANPFVWVIRFRPCEVTQVRGEAQDGSTLEGRSP